MSGDVNEIDDDTRAQFHDRIAELLSELSGASDAPKGVELTGHFSVQDVNFDDESWMQRVVDVQGWLRLDDDLPQADPTAFVESLSSALGFEPAVTGFKVLDDRLQLSEAALERLTERIDLAARLQQAFISEMETDGSSQGLASANWVDAWAMEEGLDDQVPPEPVTAKTDVWAIDHLTRNKLNLTPSYQRGDVWSTGDRQALLESILRGIPLPSIILLRAEGDKRHEVVDGKQRLTTILRFVGRHPVALERVHEASEMYPEAEFVELFRSDYPKFRRAWKKYMGEPLTVRQEDEYYFPFKLRNDAKGGLVGPDLELLQGKYYSEIRDNTIHVADEPSTVEELFEGMPAYRVPVIVYTKATQQQIHEVFKLYNKQGMHLNAEEIRNAVYHDIELTRAILAAAGDVSAPNRIQDVAPSIVDVEGIADLAQTLADYGFGTTRYRRTKVLGWIISVLVNSTDGKQMPSTARHIDLLLDRVQIDKNNPLREPERISDLFGLIATAAELHAAHDELWPESFRGDGKSGKWQDLQLVGSLVGIALAVAGSPDDIERRIEDSAERVREAAQEDWMRPEKTQTRTQWDYIARIVRGVTDQLGVDIGIASSVIRDRFGSSGIESLLASRIQDLEA